MTRRTKKRNARSVRRFNGRRFTRHSRTFNKKVTARAWARSYKKRSPRRRARVVREGAGKFAVFKNPCHIGGRGTYTTPAEWKRFYASPKGQASLRLRKRKRR